MKYKRCLICSEWDACYSIALCRDCVEQVKKSLRPKFSHQPSPKFFEIIALLDYTPIVSGLIKHLKFQPTLSKEIFELLLSFASYLDADALKDSEALCPIPPNFMRSLQQLDLGSSFAMALESTHKIPLNHGLLYQRNLFSKSQKHKVRHERLFKISDNKKGFGITAIQSQNSYKKLLLVDDVCSSGATIMAAKKSLETSGFAVSRAIVLASNL